MRSDVLCMKVNVPSLARGVFYFVLKVRYLSFLRKPEATGFIVRLQTQRKPSQTQDEVV